MQINVRTYFPELTKLLHLQNFSFTQQNRFIFYVNFESIKARNLCLN